MVLRYEHIVVATDGSSRGEQALIASANLGRQFGARVDIVHVFNARLHTMASRTETYGEVMQRLGSKAHDMVARWVAKHFEGIRTSAVAVAATEVAPAVLDHVKTSGADLCIVGTRGREGLERLALGSVAESVARRATCDVLVVPHGAKATDLRARVVAATDFSRRGNDAIDVAAQLSDGWLHVVNIVTPLGDAATRWRLRSRMTPPPHDPVEAVTLARSRLRAAGAQRAGTDANYEVILHDDAATGIRAYAEQVDASLCVVGTTGRSGLNRLLMGSVAERVVRAPTTPVLVVRDPVDAGQQRASSPAGRTSTPSTKGSSARFS